MILLTPTERRRIWDYHVKPCCAKCGKLICDCGDEYYQTTLPYLIKLPSEIEAVNKSSDQDFGSLVY